MRFDELKLGIADWENFFKCHAVSSVEINCLLNSFSKVICDLYQVGDKILPDSKLNFSGNSSRDNFSNNYLNEGKD